MVVKVAKTEYEYSLTEYYVKDVSINEFINLFELMNRYDGYEMVELVPVFDGKYLDRFSYAVPDAGMETNQVIQINENDVLIRFVWSL